MGRVWLELTVILECSSVTEPSLAEQIMLAHSCYNNTGLNHEIEASLDCLLRPYLSFCLWL